MEKNKKTKIAKKVFRAYDIRGEVGNGIDADLIYLVGCALGSQIQSEGQREVVVGRDGRLSGPELIKALNEGLMDSGVDVIDVGEVPTPVLYFATQILEPKSGVMLTASHNPAGDNGLKMVVNGRTLAEQDIQNLYQRIVNDDLEEGAGGFLKQDILSEYIKKITSDVKLKKPLKVVVDCGNGIAGRVAPELFKALGCEVVELFCEVDGNFPNHHPDPSVVENVQDLIAAVKTHKADIGLGFDGDGDRLGVIDNQGHIIWPDRQMMLYAINVLSQCPGEQIIFDVKCSAHLARVIKEYGGEPVMWKTGHSLLKAKLKQEKAPLGGEMSGHICFNDRWSGFDDALYTAARLLEMVAQDGRSVSDIFAALPDSVNTPELKLYVQEDRKFSLMEALKANTSFENANVVTIDGLRVEFEDGWGLVRASNTSPCLTMRFEANDENSLQEVKEKFRQQLLAVDADLNLPF